MNEQLYEVRDSPVHGTGVFATGKIKKGTRIIEYTGERISTKEGERRYDDDQNDYAFVLLFTVDKKTVLDGGVGGSDAKYINHSCDPNCEATIDKKRVFIEAIRDIEPGEELNYDYAFERDKKDDGSRDGLYACRCGAANCRGSMLVELKTKDINEEALKRMKKDIRKELKKDIKKLKKSLQKDAKKKLAKARKNLKKAAAVKAKQNKK